MGLELLPSSTVKSYWVQSLKDKESVEWEMPWIWVDLVVDELTTVVYPSFFFAKGSTIVGEF